LKNCHVLSNLDYIDKKHNEIDKMIIMDYSFERHVDIKHLKALN